MTKLLYALGDEIHFVCEGTKLNNRIVKYMFSPCTPMEPIVFNFVNIRLSMQTNAPETNFFLWNVSTLIAKHDNCVL